jgi:hypothetical protein
MIITKHVVPRKETKSRKTKTSNKCVELVDSDSSDESDDADDKDGSTRAFSPNGFVMVFCSVGLDTPVTASDSVKTKVIGFIVELSLHQPDCLLWYSQHPCGFQDDLYETTFSSSVLFG